MSDLTKINSMQLSRLACVYLRQSSAAQVEHNRESTARQYALVAKAADLGWPAQQVLVIDEDLGISGSGIIERSGFARLTAEVALGHVGIVLGLEVSRLARNNADWYRLLDLCGVTDTQVASPGTSWFTSSATSGVPLVPWRHGAQPGFDDLVNDLIRRRAEAAHRLGQRPGKQMRDDRPREELACHKGMDRSQPARRHLPGQVPD